jgi:hypothetical protein
MAATAHFGGTHNFACHFVRASIGKNWQQKSDEGGTIQHFPQIPSSRPDQSNPVCGRFQSIMMCNGGAL